MRNHFLRASGVPGSSIVTDNLMFHLDAGNSESYGDQTTLWKDLTSNNNDFSKYGAPTHDASTNGGIFTLDGTDDAFYCAHNSTQVLQDKNFTFEIWIKVLDLQSTTWVKYLQKARSTTGWTDTGSQSKIELGWNGSSYPYGRILQRSNGTTHADEKAEDGSTQPINSWKHMVLTADFDTSISDGMKLYMNNVLEGSGDISDFSGASGELDMVGDFVIGNFKQSTNWGTKFVNMSTSIVRVYSDKALTASEVTTNWDAEKARHGY